MKKNILSKIKCLVLAASALMCFSCGNDLDLADAPAGKTKVLIGSVMRTAFPDYDTSDFRDVVLSGKLHGTSAAETTYAEWQTLSSAVAEMNSAVYDLTLTAKAGGFTYKGTLENQNISGTSVTLTFPMKMYSVDSSELSGTGSFEVKLAFKSTDVTKVKATLYTVTNSNEVIVSDYSDKNISITTGDGTDGISSSYKVAVTSGENLAGGHYVVKWDLYAGNVKLVNKESVFEDIYIDSGKTSKSVKKLDSTEAKFNLTFNLNGGSWKDGYTAPSAYSRIEKPALPQEANLNERNGFSFDGWYTSEDFSGSAVTSISSSTSGDLTYYAKWTAKTGSLSLTGNMDGAEFKFCSAPTSFKADEDVILPRPVKEGYNFRGWYADPAKANGTVAEELGDRIARTSKIPYSENVTLYAKWEPVTKVSMVYAYDIAKITAKTGDNKIPLTHVCMAFIAHETGTTDIQYRDYNDSTTMSKVNAFRAAYPNTKLIGSYAGGDEGSHKCSELIADDANAAANRKVIIQNIVDFVAKYNLDGVDLDWEYFGSYDKYNPVYAEFTTELRAALDENFRDYILLTIAVQKGKNFHQNSLIKEMLCKFDFIGLMTYDCGSSFRGEFSSTSADSNGQTRYVMGTKKVPHISFNGRHKTSTYVNGDSTTGSDTSDVSAVINAYAATTGADKLVAGIGYYGHAYYILPSGFQVEVPSDETDNYRDKGKKSGASKAYYATVADIANDKIVEGLATIHPAQGSTYSAADWGNYNSSKGYYRWDYKQQKIAAGSTYDYSVWKSFAKEQGIDKGKIVTTGHFTSQDSCIAYSYFQTDVNYTFTTTDGVSHTEKLYALFIYDDVTAITNKVSQYVKPVSQGGLGCGGAMAWVFEGDADNDLHGALNDAVMDNCTLPAQEWTYPAGGHGAYQPPKIVKVTRNAESATKWQAIVNGFEVGLNDVVTVTIKAPGSYTEPYLRSVNSSTSYTKFRPTNKTASSELSGYDVLTATASEDTAGLLITLDSGAFATGSALDAYIAEITINNVPVDLYDVGSGGSYSATVSLIDPPNN